MKNPREMRSYILKTSTNLSNRYKILHTLYGLEHKAEARKYDKTYQYARNHKLSRVQMWDLSIRLLKARDLEYLPKVTRDKDDPFNQKVILYAYVYRKNIMYIKYYVNNEIINLRSLHPTISKDSRFKRIGE